MNYNTLLTEVDNIKNIEVFNKAIQYLTNTTLLSSDYLDIKKSAVLYNNINRALLFIKGEYKIDIRDIILSLTDKCDGVLDITALLPILNKRIMWILREEYTDDMKNKIKNETIQYKSIPIRDIVYF